MFNKSIRVTDTKFVSDIANRMFDRITGEPFRDDYSMVATLRALLIKRMGEDEKFFVKMTRSSYSKRDYERNSISSIVTAMVGSDRRIAIGHALFVFNLTGDDEANATFFDKVSHVEYGLQNLIPDATEVSDVENFIADKMKAKIFFSTESKAAYIFTERLNTRKLHLLEVFIPRYLPWFFENQSFDEKEHDLLIALSRTDPQPYIDIMRELAESYDMRSYAIKTVLDGFEQRANERRLNSLYEEERTINNDIDDYVRHYRTLINRLENTRIRIEGVRSIINKNSGESELVQLFTRMQNLDPIDSYESTFSFIIKTYLVNFDPDMFERCANNEDSAISLVDEYSSSFDNAEDRRMFLDAIFSEEPLLKIKMCAYMTIDLRGQVNSARNYDFGPEYNDYIPNPHLNQHNCFGNHQPIINELLRSGDVVSAIMQCIASAGSVNVAEGVTIGPMLAQLYTTTGRVIELPDGTSVTPPEALNWLKERNQPTTETTTEEVENNG